MRDNTSTPVVCVTYCAVWLQAPYYSDNAVWTCAALTVFSIHSHVDSTAEFACLIQCHILLLVALVLGAVLLKSGLMFPIVVP